MGTKQQFVNVHVSASSVFKDNFGRLGSYHYDKKNGSCMKYYETYESLKSRGLEIMGAKKVIIKKVEIADYENIVCNCGIFRRYKNGAWGNGNGLLLPIRLEKRLEKAYIEFVEGRKINAKSK